MSNNNSPQQTGQLAGFRLRRLEILNWGTFNGKVSILAPEGRWTLLVGDNGTGKSTAVDALRTLLVPPRLLTGSYNESGKEVGLKRKADRSKRSYIRGAWTVASREESAQGAVQYLRAPGVQSVILGVFSDESKKKAVTLVQVMWESNDKTEEVYAVAEGDKNIREHVAGSDELRDIRRRLRVGGFIVSNTYSGYAEHFRGLFGIPSESAMEVFNQAIGAKQIDDLNRFIRQHMLAGHDAVEFIRGTLQPHYTELYDCQLAIDRAERQIRALEPLAERYARLETTKAEREDLVSLLAAAPVYFDLKLRSLLTTKIESHERTFNDLSAAKQELEAAQVNGARERDNLKAALARDEVEIRIQELNGQMREATNVLQVRQSKAGDFARSLRTLGLVRPFETQEQFNEIIQWVRTRSQFLAGERTDARQESISREADRREAAQRYAKLKSELLHLQAQDASIPSQFSALRKILCEAGGISVNDLPFVGELVQVSERFREWTGVIERLLRGFGLSLLVPERCYDAVSKYVNGRRLVDPLNPRSGLRLEYYRITHLPPMPRTRSEDLKMVFGRLEFHSEHQLSPWVATLVAQRFRHVCCETIEEFQQQLRAVTREGLVRSADRHLKDDRQAITDASEFILGWSNRTKLEAVRRECEAINTQIQGIGTAIEAAATRERSVEAQWNASQAAAGIAVFTDVDVRAAQQNLHELAKQRSELENSSEKRKILTQQIAALDDRIAERKQKVDDLTGRIAVIESDLATFRRRLSVIQVGSDDALFKRTEEQLTAQGISLDVALDELEEVRRNAGTVIQNEIAKRDNSINQVLPRVQKQMTDFLNEWPDGRKSLNDDIAYAPEFIHLLHVLREEQLPKYQQRFEEFLGTNLVGDIASFNARLHDEEKQIRSRIQEVNAALRSIPFSADTYLEVVAFPNRTEEIANFKAHILRCLSRTLHPTPEERPEIFRQIKLLMETFNTDEHWTRRVTDVRNWLDFGVKIRAQADDHEVQFFDKSSGISVGQKARLAFAILGAAICAQYRLVDKTRLENSTFRLVVIDEVFGHTDEDKSIRALEIFRSLDLQLIIVSPFDAKARIAEDYVDSFHLTTNPDGANSRIRKASRAEYESLATDATQYATAGTNS